MTLLSYYPGPGLELGSKYPFGLPEVPPNPGM